MTFDEILTPVSLRSQKDSVNTVLQTKKKGNTLLYEASKQFLVFVIWRGDLMMFL